MYSGEILRDSKTQYRDGHMKSPMDSIICSLYTLLNVRKISDYKRFEIKRYVLTRILIMCIACECGIKMKKKLSLTEVLSVHSFIQSVDCRDIFLENMDRIGNCISPIKHFLARLSFK